jgi:hypothetical protein
MSSESLVTADTFVPAPSDSSKRVTVGPRDTRVTLASTLNWASVAISARCICSSVRRLPGALLPGRRMLIGGRS